jgi:DNA-binding NarL/FixJ family response regulator
MLLVEDHNTLREALAVALNRQPNFEVGAQTASLADGRSAMALGGIAVAIVGSELPDGTYLSWSKSYATPIPAASPFWY